MRVFLPDDTTLPDDIVNTRPQNAERVNVYEEHEVAYCCKKFGVIPSQLRAAVEKVGTSPRRLETELRRR